MKRVSLLLAGLTAGAGALAIVGHPVSGDEDKKQREVTGQRLPLPAGERVWVRGNDRGPPGEGPLTQPSPSPGERDDGLKAVTRCHPALNHAGKCGDETKKPELAFRIEMAKEPYRPFEPIPMKLVLENIGRSTTQVNGRLLVNRPDAPQSRNEGDVYFVVKRLCDDDDCKETDGAGRKFIDVVMAPWLETTDFVWLAPNEKLERTYDDIARAFSLRDPGDYVVAAVYSSFQDGTGSMWRGKIRSNKVRISVGGSAIPAPTPPPPTPREQAINEYFDTTVPAPGEPFLSAVPSTAKLMVTAAKTEVNAGERVSLILALENTSRDRAMRVNASMAVAPYGSGDVWLWVRSATGDSIHFGSSVCRLSSARTPDALDLAPGARLVRVYNGLAADYQLGAGEYTIVGSYTPEFSPARVGGALTDALGSAEFRLRIRR